MTNKSFSMLKLFSLSAPVKGAIQYPITKTIFGSYIYLFSKFRFFCYAAWVFSLVISLIYIASGQNLFCYFGQFSHEEMCSLSLFMFIFSRIIILYLISMFCVRYYQIVWQNKTLTLKQVLRPSLTDIYAFVSVIVFFAINSIALLSGYLLKIRVPNPDWRIELCYFGIVGLGMLVPFVLLRFYPLFISVWRREKFPDVSDVWLKSRGNNFTLILSIGLWGILWSLLSSFFLGEFAVISAQVSYWGVFVGEYLYNFMFLAVIACLVNSCALQYSFLQGDKPDEQSKKRD